MSKDELLYSDLQKLFLTSHSALTHTWIDGKRASQVSGQWIWTDGTDSCGVEDIDVMDGGVNDCRSLAVSKQGRSFVRDTKCTTELPFLCKRQKQPSCLPDPGAPCNIPSEGEEGGENKLAFTVLYCTILYCTVLYYTL